MRNAALLGFILLVPQVHASGFEDAGRLGAEAAAKGRQLAPRVAAHSRILKGQTQSTDLSMLFELGAKPQPEDLTGWYSGRRFTAAGPGAQLLVGSEVYEDAGSGPLGGKAFKLMLFPYVGGVLPADLYDEPGTHLVDTVQTLMRENAKSWSTLTYTDTGAVWKKGGAAYEIRKWGRYLICKYPDGGFGYFFKKVSPVAGAGAYSLKSNEGALQPPAAILPLPGSDKLSALFDAGTAPTDAAMTGWFAGRRFTSGGPAAGLIVGLELYDNQDAGPIDGSTFKVVIFGPDKPGIIPVELFDLGGSAMIDGVAWNLREAAPLWTTTRTDSGLNTSKDGRTHEVRQSGELFVVRYPEGYGYFFKKIR